ncbi:MAG TPA: 30S ribosomal protein S12 methylthiotransferase RimO [Phycisphaerales bacterium]|nr:30S ribosomal protein S12 methylthiotransferase RimO [Phycisphaerales bacterium]
MPKARSSKPQTQPSRTTSRSKPKPQPKPKSVETVSFVSLGCPKNLVDSEKMLGLLAESGLAPISFDPDAQDFNGADAVVVNTCGFLEASKDESLGVIKEAIAAKERGHVQRVVVAGCLVQRHRAKMLEWAPGIDAMIGVFDRDKIVEAVTGGSGGTGLLTGARKAPAPQDGDTPQYWIAGNALQAAKARGVQTTGLTVNGKDGKGLGYFEDDSARLRLTPRHYAYLRISEGCNQNCAFCTIPSIRGKMRSKPLDRIVGEARELLSDGAFELLLIGQDTTSYGDDIGVGMQTLNRKSVGGLPMLLRELSNTVRDVNGQGWLRLMYAYPSNFSDAVIDAFAELSSNGHLLPYLDIPLQHASTRVLSAMRRHVTSEQQEALINRLRERVPGMAIRTTFISGFPGETEQDHQELLSFIERMQFEAVGVFEYSQEPGTVAGTMEQDSKLAVPADVKKRRRDEVMERQQQVAFARAASLANGYNEKTRKGGTQLDVLIDAPLSTHGQQTSGVSKGGKLYQGRTYFQAPQIDSMTYVQSREKLAPGELVRCTIVAADGYDLIARPTAELDGGVKLRVLR